MVAESVGTEDVPVYVPTAFRELGVMDCRATVPYSVSVPATKSSWALDTSKRDPDAGNPLNVPATTPASWTLDQVAVPIEYVVTMKLVPSAAEMTIAPPQGLIMGVSMRSIV